MGLTVGCRKALLPSVDNNQAPETWITAAPQDTITDRGTVPATPPIPGRIPVRYHLYWAGSDRDGAVTGFYWAVVETLPIPPGDNLPIPNLPGPKARDYRFTTRTDSTFIFTASEAVSEREHAFFIYSIDDKGKPDPTPARFLFRAYDRFPPIAIFDEASAVGRVYELGPGGVTPIVLNRTITDSFEVSRPFPRDTVPSRAVLTFRWHGEPTAANTHVVGFRYKLDEPDFNAVDSSVHVATYNTGVGGDVVSPGLKRFTLRAVGESGWRSQVTRYFQMNFAPDSWFSGPDVTDPTQGWQSYSDGNKTYYYKDIPSWEVFPGIPNTMLSSDSVSRLPAERPERRTFFEIYKDRLWAHQEGDTVHLNSWVCFPAGGFDTDSPYHIKVGVDPNKPIGPATTSSDSANGSPIGFRSLVLTRKTPGNNLVRPTETTTYPVFDVASVFHNPHMSAYAPMTTSGTVFAYAVAEDGDGTIDRRIQREGGPDVIVDRYDSGQASPSQIAIRPKILKFYVNHAPYLKVNDPQFTPKTSVPIGTRSGFFNILADDIDPIDDAIPVTQFGGPQSPPHPVLVRTVDFIGRNAAGDTVIANLATGAENANIFYSIPSSIVPGPCTVRITLSDVRARSETNWGGRTVVTEIPVTLTAPVPADVGEPEPAPTVTQRPGSTEAPGRRPSS